MSVNLVEVVAPMTEDRYRPRKLFAAWGEIREQALAAGAVLLRGFGEWPVEAFPDLCKSLLGSARPYRQGNSPRTRLGSDAPYYTSTEYPSEYRISLHNELSYTANPPDLLVFGAVTAAALGGETLLCDGHELFEAVGAEVRNAFLPGVIYYHNMHNGAGLLGRSWQDTFEAQEKDAVAQWLTRQGAEWRWRHDESLTVVQKRPSSVELGGRSFWFNQADQWHWSNLDPDLAAMMRNSVQDDRDLPLHATLADNTEIDPNHLEAIRTAAFDLAYAHSWFPGDVLIVNNHRTLHGRNSFRGDRNVLLSMHGGV